MSSAVEIASTISAEATSLTFRTGATRTGSASSGRIAPPALIPISQAYYWTRAWQESEQQAVRDLREGRSRVFADMDAALAYLLDGED